MFFKVNAKIPISIFLGERKWPRGFLGGLKYLCMEKSPLDDIIPVTQEEYNAIQYN